MIGAFGVAKTTPGAFSDSQIGILQSFSDHAVVGLGLHEGDGNMRFVAGLPSEYIPNWKESRYRFSLKLLRPEGQWRTHFQMDANDLPAPRFGDAATKMLARRASSTMAVNSASL